MQNISKRLPDLKSKNKSKKILCKNLLANIKLMCFIPINHIDIFYNLINFFCILKNIFLKIKDLKKRYGIIVKLFWII